MHAFTWERFPVSVCFMSPSVLIDLGSLLFGDHTIQSAAYGRSEILEKNMSASAHSMEEKVKV